MLEPKAAPSAKKNRRTIWSASSSSATTNISNPPPAEVVQLVSVVLVRVSKQEPLSPRESRADRPGEGGAAHSPRVACAGRPSPAAPRPTLPLLAGGCVDSSCIQHRETARSPRRTGARPHHRRPARPRRWRICHPRANRNGRVARFLPSRAVAHNAATFGTARYHEGTPQVSGAERVTLRSVCRSRITCNRN